jgi:hypothetical protein
MAMVGGVLQGAVDQNNFIRTLVQEFDVDFARWQELDAIGLWAGLDRNLRATAPGIYVPAPPAGVVPLGDDDYRTLLHGKIGANLWDGTINGAFDHLTGIFGTSGSVLFMIDHQDMTMTIAVAGAVPSAAFKAALSGGYMQVRPAGVLADYAYPSAPGGPLFGFDVENQFIAGFDVGVWATT